MVKHFFVQQTSLADRADDRLQPEVCLVFISGLLFCKSLCRPLDLYFQLKFRMSRFDLIKRKDASIAKEIDKDCTNKWCWSWLDKKVDDELEAIGTWCDKVKESGKAYCCVRLFKHRSKCQHDCRCVCTD